MSRRNNDATGQRPAREGENDLRAPDFERVRPVISLPVVEKVTPHTLVNVQVQKKVDEMIKSLIQDRRPPVDEFQYPTHALKVALSETLHVEWSSLSLSLLDRTNSNTQGKDYCLDSYTLRTENLKRYKEKILPAWKSAIEASSLYPEFVTSVEHRGMFLNIALSDKFFVDAAHKVLNLGGSFGRTNSMFEHRVVLDYSSPNAAKHLHAGHIRSTIIGEVLANICEANGAISFRINHVNDWGGFGYILEGFERWNKKMKSAGIETHKIPANVYLVFRTAQKAAESEVAFQAADRGIMTEYFGRFDDYSNFCQLYDEFRKKSELRFSCLEGGDPAEIELWQRVVDLSLEDFSLFYGSLGIKKQTIIPESFYVEVGNLFVDCLVDKGIAVRYTRELADLDRSEIFSTYPEESQIKIRQSLFEGIEKDVGATVIPLASHDRMVIRREDGATIYATRDLCALAYRRENFDATKIIYVVGQEQKSHFAQLFEAAQKLGLTGGGEVECSHLSFGHYVTVEDSKRRKLSSRDGAASVHLLMSKTYEHFLNKLESSKYVVEQADREHAGRQLMRGSILFNDLTKTVGTDVILNSNLAEVIEQFEKSGGAYVMYAACRAAKIILDSGVNLKEVETGSDTTLEPIEINLLKKLAEFPSVVAQAGLKQQPNLLFGYLLDTAQVYSSYYNDPNFRVFDNGLLVQKRLMVHAAANQVLRNGLAIANIDCPERI